MQLKKDINMENINIDNKYKQKDVKMNREEEFNVIRRLCFN